MSKHRNRRKKSAQQLSPGTQGTRQSHPRTICGWCGEPIKPGDESDNLYEPDAAYQDRIPSAMGYVHKKHVYLEDHPLYEQMPHIVISGLPFDLEGVYDGF